MTRTEAKKQELLNFIKWKIRFFTEQEQKETLQKCKNMSYKALREWAIRNDFID